ncbi:hypothetical protein VTI74DRAFT_6971 [Chaetomium olivicolor]
MIESVLARGAYKIKQLSPLKNKNEKLASSKSLAAQAVSRWIYKYPDDPNSTKKMSWVTYQAILKKEGGPFQSNGAGRPYYDFPSALGTPFLTTLLEEWLEHFQVELPKTEQPLLVKTNEIWSQYVDELRRHIHATAPDIIPYFDDTHKTLHGIETELLNSISTAIKSISDGSSQIHPVFIQSLRRNLIPFFAAALKITGKGHFTHRQSNLRTGISDASHRLFSSSYTRMEGAYHRRTGSLPREFHTMARSAVGQVKTQIGLLLNNLQAHVSGRDRTALDKKLALQKRAKAVVLAWAAEWRAPGGGEGDEREGDGNGGKGKGLEIPREYVEEVNGEERGKDGGRSEDGDDKSETDSGSESDSETYED